MENLVDNFVNSNHETFFAVTDDGRQIPLSWQTLNGSILLTLKKELLATVEKVRVLPTLGNAHAGDSGYWIIPRENTYSGDIQTFLRNVKIKSTLTEARLCRAME